MWTLTASERLRIRVQLEVVYAKLLGLDALALNDILKDCDRPKSQLRRDEYTKNLSPRGFWRVDQDMQPELRLSVLAQVAFNDLQQMIDAAGGDRDAGIAAFLAQNQGEGWMLPETLRLADYGLGHDERAEQPQPVASRLGPRFYDWQLAQTAEESWRECRLHARNLLGEAGYQKLLGEIEAERNGTKPASAAPATAAAKAPPTGGQQGSLFG